MARKQPKYVFFEDELYESEDENGYSLEEKEDGLEYLIESNSPIDKHHPSAILGKFRSACILSEFLERPEFVYLSEYLRVWNEGKRLIYKDDKEAFSSFIKSNWDIIEKLPPVAFLHSICSFSAVGCATVLFESRLNVNLNMEEQKKKLSTVLFGSGLIVNAYMDMKEQKKLTRECLCEYSLYNAVSVRSIPVEIIKLFLEHGANPDTWPYEDLPIACVLVRLSYMNYTREWTQEKSIFKLFYLLCLPELEETLEIIKLLASHMKLVDKVLSHLIEEGQFLQLAALLIAASDKLLVSSAKDGGLMNTSVGKYLMAELRNESDVIRSLTDAEVLDPSKFQRNSNLVFAFNMVSTIWNSIHVLHNYRVSARAKSVSKDRVPFDIAADLISKAKLVLHPSDVYCNDIKCLRPDHPFQAQEMARAMCSRRPSCVYAERHGAEFSRFISPSMSQPSCRLFHTCSANHYNIKKHIENQLFKTTLQAMPLLLTSFPSTTINKKPGVPPLWFTSWMSSCFNIMTPAKNHLSKTTQMESSMCNVSALLKFRLCTPLIWIAKRSIKYPAFYKS